MQRIFQCLLVLILNVNAYAYNSEDIVPNEVIVRFKSSQHQFMVLGKLAAGSQLKSKKSWPKMRIQHFVSKSSDRIDDVIARLKEDPNVEYAEPNFYVRASEIYNPMTSARVKIPESWNLIQETMPIDELPVVAIIDSGLDLSHEIFNSTDRVYLNQGEIPNNGIDDDHNGYIDDINGWNFVSNNKNVQDDTGHGTHVSGIVLGSTENIFAFNASQSPKIQIMPLKFLDRSGVGKTSDAIEAINYAIERGVKVINNSWGGPSYSASLHSALTTAYERGIVIVTAAGNYSSNNDSVPVYPANLDVPSLLSVGSTTNNDNIAFFSNYGVESVHVYAPGSSIYSAELDGDFEYLSGTSMSAPFVSGLAALISYVAPNLSGYQIRELILNSSDSILIRTNNGQSTTVPRINFKSGIEAAYAQSETFNYQPDYSPIYSQGSRNLASTSTIGSGVGCGRLQNFYGQQNKNVFENDNFVSQYAEIHYNLVFLLIPFVLVVIYRQKMKKKNTRQHPRKSVEIAGQLIMDNGWVFPVNVKDISASGAGLQILDYEEGFKIEKNSGLVLNLIFGKGEKIRYKAQVMHSSEDGFLGVQFKKKDLVELLYGSQQIST